MLKITGYVMKLAPLAVMAAMAATVATNGLEILLKFAVFMGDFYIGLIILWALLAAAGYTFLGKRVFQLLALIKEAFLLSFATASSEAAYPKILDALDRFGVKRKISAFVMPMGYSFNLDGSMMYCTFATLFIAQAYGIHLSLGTQVTMMLILMLTSKGMAGVPRASLVVIAATLNQFNIPEAGLLLILGVDTFLDMGRSATNAVGNSIASAVVAKWEGELLPQREADAHAKTLDTNVAPMALPRVNNLLRARRGARISAIPAKAGTRFAETSGPGLRRGDSPMASVVFAPAHAQSDRRRPASPARSQKVQETGAITIGYRESSVPFSYLSARNEPIGYSIDLCKQLVEAIGETVGRNVTIKWLPVTSESRIAAVTSGRVDLECGSTTSNLERQKQVAFSPTMFVSGTKLMVRKGSPIRSYLDLAGKRVVVTAGTTNQKAIEEVKRRSAST